MTASTSVIGNVISDLIGATRGMRAEPAWTTVLIGVLAAGIGLTVASFLLIDIILFRPLGIEAQERVLRLGRTDESRAWMNSSAWPLYEQFARIDGVFQEVAAEGWPDALHLRHPDGSRERITGRAVSGDYFRLLGVRMANGRALDVGDDRAEAPPAVVVSHRFWRRHLGGSVAAVGTPLHINQTAYTIVGVAPPEFRGMQLEALDVWLPARVAMRPNTLWTDRDYNAFEVFARLRDGVTVPQADAAVDTALLAYGTDQTGQHGMAVPVTRFGNFIRDKDEIRSATLLGAGALCMLLLASVNAAGLLLVRAERRRGELALCAALGARRSRLVQQQWISAAVPVAIATVLGLGLGYGLASLAVASAGAQGVFGVERSDFPGAGRSLVLAAAVLLVCSLVSAAPAMARAGASRLSAQLASGMGSGRRSGKRWYGGRSLVILQFALTLCVASAGALAIDRFIEQWRAPLGPVRAETLVMAMDYGPDSSADTAALAASNRALIEHLRGSGEFTAVAMGGMVPIASNSMTISVSRLTVSGEWHSAEGYYNPVGEDFFRALDIPLLQGRAFEERDAAGAAPVVIVSAQTAERLWPGQSAVGRSLRWDGMPGTTPIEATVVGVTANVRYHSASESTANIFYVPVEQRIFGAARFVVAAPRPGLPADRLSRTLQQAASRVEPDRAPGEVETVQDRVAAIVAGPAFLASIATAFGTLAILLAAAGIYGAFSYLVAARKRDLAIRMAIGSTPRELYRLVLREAMVLVAAGAGLGAFASFVLVRTSLAAAFDSHTLAEPTFLLVAAAVCAAGIFAVLPAARAAAATDPQAALRADG